MYFNSAFSHSLIITNSRCMSYRIDILETKLVVSLRNSVILFEIVLILLGVNDCTDWVGNVTPTTEQLKNLITTILT